MVELYIDECTHLNSSKYNEDDDIFNNQYTKLNTIGSGAFGTVYKAIDNETNVTVAIKQITKTNSNYTSIMKEIAILKSLHHPNIVKYESFIETASYIYIIMEYLSGGTLRAYITSHKDTLNENTARVITKQLLNAVEYLHLTCDICHRDIKPSNIMLSNENDITCIKLLDFGLSVDTFEYNRMIENCGTLIYMAPEQLRDCTVYYKSVDMWSVGIITYMLINKGEHPFYKLGDSTTSVINAIKQCTIEYDMNVFSEMAKMFICKLIDKNEVNRYNAKNALVHPWITLNMLSDIPLNIYEQYAVNECKRKLKIMVIAVMMCKSVIKTKKGSEECNEKYVNAVKDSEEVQKRKMIKKRERMFMNGKELNEVWEKERNGNECECNSVNNVNNNKGGSRKGYGSSNASKKIVIELRNKQKSILINSNSNNNDNKQSNSVNKHNCNRFKKKEEYLIWKKQHLNNNNYNYYNNNKNINHIQTNILINNKKQYSQSKNINKSLKNLNLSSYITKSQNESIITNNNNNNPNNTNNTTNKHYPHHNHQPSHSKYTLNKLILNPSRKSKYLAPINKK